MTDAPTRVSMSKVIPKDDSGKVIEMAASSGRSGTNHHSSSPTYALHSPKTPSAPASPTKGTRLHIMGASMQDLKLNFFRPRTSKNNGAPSRQEDIGISVVSLQFSNTDVDERRTQERCVKYKTWLKFGSRFTVFFIPLLVHHAGELQDQLGGRRQVDAAIARHGLPRRRHMILLVIFPWGT
jgi:hypothetical protein